MLHVMCGVTNFPVEDNSLTSQYRFVCCSRLLGGTDSFVSGYLSAQALERQRKAVKDVCTTLLWMLDYNVVPAMEQLIHRIGDLTALASELSVCHSSNTEETMQQFCAQWVPGAQLPSENKLGLEVSSCV